MNNYIKLFLISCTTGPTYCNVVVVGTRCRTHYTPIGLFATTLHSDSAKYIVFFVQHCQNRNRNIITTEISRFMDEKVHINAYVVSLG